MCLMFPQHPNMQHELSTRCTFHVSSTSSAKAPLVVESTRSAVKTAAAVPSCTDLDPKGTQLSSKARRTAPKYSLCLSVACQKSSSNFWSSLVFARIIRLSSEHTARTPILWWHQASAAECTCTFCSRRAKPSFTLANLTQRKSKGLHFCKSSNFLEHSSICISSSFFSSESSDVQSDTATEAFRG